MIAFACHVDHDPREPSEHKLQVDVLSVIDVGKVHPDIYAFAIPNAGRRSWKTGIKMKAEGLRRGFADLGIMLPGGRAAWMELKKRKGGRTSDEQLGFEARCRRLGHPYARANTLDQAIAALKEMGVIRCDL